MSSKVSWPDKHISLERGARVRAGDKPLSSPEPLGEFSGVHAWVLIADPGAGKTDVFETLSATEGGYYTNARDFVALELPPDWTAPIFIDGLDEITAGNAAGSTALEQIRTKLQRLGTPRFRISCREADWRGNTDSAALKRLVKDGSFLELHLAPLDLAQTKALVMHWQTSNDAAATQFIRQAKRHDLEGLLDNPQTLRMLVKAISATENAWPGSKTKTYEMACAQLVREHSHEHLAAKRHNPLGDDKILKAAGYLSAIILLSGSAAIALRQSDTSPSGLVILPELVAGDASPALSTCQAALETRLFKGGDSGDYWPAHRTVAEYLGAQYLVSRIQAGLPPNRVMALLLGQDDGVVPELRGLHAWLAASVAADLRRELIEHDPLGVIINGDVRNFTRTEKLHVLNALRDEAAKYTYFRNQHWASNPFGALATVDMMEDFKAMLRSADRSAPHQALIDCVLDALANGHHMTELAPELEQIVRDKTYWPGSRKEALGILVAYAGEGNNWHTLSTLLADVQGNVVEDAEDELLGTLLNVLYPGQMPSSELWRYFRNPKSEGLVGAYRAFWNGLAGKSASSRDAPILLDALHTTGYRLSAKRDNLGSSEVIGELLVRGVTLHGHQIEIARLWGWLSLGLAPQFHCPLGKLHKAALGQWLGERTSIYKALFEYGLRQPRGDDGSGFGKLWRIRAHLYGAPESDDAGQWYLSLAQATPDADLRRTLVNEAFNFVDRKQGPDSALRIMERWSADHVGDAEWVQDRLTCPYPPSDQQQKQIDYEIEDRESTAKESREKVNFFREALPSFKHGPAHLGALRLVANAYLNFFGESDQETRDARLLELLNHNKEWVELALHGLRQCLFRDDLPLAADIVDLNVQGHRYNLAEPCLAAMELRQHEDPASALDLPATTLEAAALFRLTNSFHESPAWFQRLLFLRPEIIVTAMQRLADKQIQSKVEHVDGLYSLAYDADYAEIAKKITPGLIATFPLLAQKKQLQSLRLLVVSMQLHLSRELQLSLVAEKLGGKDMDVAQHVYWLTAGMQIAPDVYQQRTHMFVGKTQSRASHLFAMIYERQETDGVQADLPPTAQGFLIELLGPTSNPSWPMKSGIVTTQMEMGRYIGGLISALSSNPSDDAVQVLQELRQRQDLKHWHDALDRALYDQRVTRRKALFKPASVAAVCATLANLKPANAADLWALTVDHLVHLIDKIRNGSSNGYGQYWAGEVPNSEDVCRDALLFALESRLEPLGIAAEREGHYADAKRADIKVIAGSLHIPIEIKREMHRDLWKAIREQLVVKYGRDSASEGYGIYLVFWFGGESMPVAGDGGTKPKSPQELKKRLAATVPSALQRKIAILVVDCSKT